MGQESHLRISCALVSDGAEPITRPTPQTRDGEGRLGDGVAPKAPPSTTVRNSKPLYWHPAPAPARPNRSQELAWLKP